MIATGKNNHLNLCSVLLSICFIYSVLLLISIALHSHLEGADGVAVGSAYSVDAVAKG